MSYDITLSKNKKPVKVKKFEEGGTQVMGGSEEAWLNVTYNYGWFYYKYLDKKEGIRWLYGKKAKDCVKRLEKTVKELGTNQYERDYWAPTPGNAGYALNILLQWAKQNPDATFSGD